ncbi:MAG: type VI secretion system baseplate subunit TssG [Candidatus Eisenbacteria bacterium]
MVTPDRSGPALIDRLLKRPRDFEFFQLVKLLRREGRGVALPGGPGPAKQENIRFRPSLSIGFPPGDIDTLAPIESDDPAEPRRYRLEVNFMGLYGPSSPMPTHFSEDFLWSVTPEDPGRDFVDLFHHRMISFVFRAWLKYRHAEQFDPRAPDDFSRRALCLLGLGTQGMAEGSGLPPLMLLKTAGLLADRHRSAAGLEQFLRAHFALPSLRVRACVEHTARVPRSQTMRLGRSTARLGDTAVLGERVADLSGTFRIELGPFEVATARRFLPGSEELMRLVRLARLYVRDPLNMELRLRIPAQNVPPLRLTERARLGLGHLTWLSPDGRHEGQATVSLRAYDPLYQRRSTPSAVPAFESKPRPAAPAVTARPAPPAKRTTPRVTSLRRP